MVDFIRTNPAADRVERGVAQGNAQALAEEEAFRRRKTFEDANATDAAIRQGIGAYYAGQSPAAAAPTQQPDAGPAASPPPAPGPTQTAAPAGMPVTVTVGHPMPPAAAPAPAPAAPAQPQGQAFANASPASGDGFGDAAPLPPEQAQATPQAPRPATPQPMARTGQGGIPNLAQQAGTQQRSMQPLIDSVTKAPGGGHTALALFTADQHQRMEVAKLDRQQRLDGMKEFLASVKDGDAQLARFTAQQYQLNVPDEFFSNRGHMMRASVAAKTAEHLFGKDNPQQTLAYVKGYLEAGPGASPDQASLAGLNAVKGSGAGGRVAGHYIDKNNQVQFYDRHGQDPNDPNKEMPPARPQKWQVAGAGGASVYEKKRAAYLAVHPGDEQGALDYAAGKRQVPAAQLRNWVEAAVAREESHRVRPFTPEERKQTRDYYEGAFGLQSGSPTLRPAPGAAKPGARPPLASFNRPAGATATATAGAPDDEDTE